MCFTNCAGFFLTGFNALGSECLIKAVTKVHIQSSHQFIHIQAIPILTLVNAKQNINSITNYLTSF
jgi:hypothetical protein